MATVLVAGYAVQFPTGGYLSWMLQWLDGLAALGHDVWFLERSTYEGSCFDPSANARGDDPAAGTSALSAALRSFGLPPRWCFVDVHGRCHGMERAELDRVIRSADLLLDLGAHGGWNEDAESVPLKVVVDGEPGATQMKMLLEERAGRPRPDFDAYFTVGQNIGTPASCAPTAGRDWAPTFYPIATRRFPFVPAPADAAYTTVMSWQAHPPFEFDGRAYGNKDVEFPRFMSLPTRVSAPLELAVDGMAPASELTSMGWRLRDAHATTSTADGFWDYIRGSRGEFSVCKQVYVATRSGWFGDRAAAYLGLGRPVVMQETGFSDHLPTGEGLFAVTSEDEAAAAIEMIERDWHAHARAARHIAEAHLDTNVVVPRLLERVGIT